MTADVFKERFGYEIDGVWFPRVTSICALTGKSDLLEKNFRFQQAALWGSMVHEAIENVLKGKPIAAESRIAPSVETFQRWQKQYPLMVDNPDQDIEKRVVDVEHGYAGTVDIVAEVEGVRSIIDVKTSINVTKDYGLQTAAYMNAYNQMESREKVCKKRWILRVDQYEECLGCLARMREKYGKQRVVGGNELCNHRWSGIKGEIEFRELTEYEHDLELFFELKERWEWLHQEWLSQIPNYEKNIRQHTLL